LVFSQNKNCPGTLARIDKSRLCEIGAAPAAARRAKAVIADKSRAQTSSLIGPPLAPLEFAEEQLVEQQRSEPNISRSLSG